MTAGESSGRGVSLAGFVLALVTVGAGTAVGLAYVPVVGSYVGTLVGGFVAGLATEERLTVESGVAAVLAGLGVLLAATLPGNGVVAAVLALGSVAPVTLLVSSVLGFAVGAFGAHFGGDLRDGLTEPVEAPASRATTDVSAGRRSTATDATDATDAADATDATDATDADEPDDADATDHDRTDAGTANSSPRADRTDADPVADESRGRDAAEFDLDGPG